MENPTMEGPGPRMRAAPRTAPPALARLPDALTRARLLALPLLWILALLRLPQALAIGAAAAAFTDVLDGMAARRLHVASRAGGARDSAADHLLSLSLVLWLWLLRPEFFREQWPALLPWTILAATVLAVALVRHRQLVNLHLYSAKAAAVAGYLFALLLLYRGAYSLPFFGLVLTLATIAAAEALLVLLSGRTDHAGGSFFSRLPD